MKISFLLSVSYAETTMFQLLFISKHVVLDLQDVLQREVNQLSGGELQRFAIGVVCVQQADM